jgi:serine/threonine protein kinase/tetratricopeptide (TPR) repeat protein
VNSIERLTTALADRYRLEHELGQGGMATVYLAEDLKHGRKVAIKVLRPELSAVIGGERFLSEIRTTAGLQHPHILGLIDSGTVPGDDSRLPSPVSPLLFYVMPFIEGETLRARLDREKQLPVDDAIRLTREVASALEFAHKRGIVHRDIKPENILLQDGQALVADFGIALATSNAGASRMTQTGMSLGTPAYMSPEQAMGERDIGPRSDVYALGAMTYEMLTGEPPFTGLNSQSIVAKVLTEQPPRLRPRRPLVSSAVENAVLTALQKLPADRFASAKEFADALSSHPDPERSEGEGSPRLTRPSRPSRLSRPVLIAAAALVLAAAGTLGWYLRRAPAAQGDSRARTIAVLPFRNISQDSAQQYFTAGMTEEIASQLSRVRALRVLGSSATAQYDGKSDRLQRMASELGVGSVVEGSVRLAGDQVRIGVELTDVRTGQRLWSEQYDRRIDDVFAVQGDVARNVSSALQATLTPVEAGRVGHVATSNPEAYQLYLRALTERAYLRAGNVAQAALLKQAIQLDTTFAAAYAMLARTHMFRGVAGEPAYLDSGFVAARRAIALDPDEALGYFAMGDLLSNLEKYSEARRSYLRALELNPGHVGAMADLANVYVMLGRYDEALDWALRAQQLDPNHPHGPYHTGLPLLGLSDDSATARFLLAAEQKSPKQPRTQGLLMWLDLRRGRNAAATERAKRLMLNEPDNTEVPPIRAELAVFTSDPDAGLLIDSLARQDPEATGHMFPETLRSMHALTLQRQGKQKEASALWAESSRAAERNLAAGAEGYAAPMELAAIAAIEGRTTEALDWLEKGYRAGWKDAVLLEMDPFFASVRQEPRYKAVIASIQQDVKDMHARAAAAHPDIFKP